MGRIVIVGAHNGDTYWIQPGDAAVGGWPITCSPGPDAPAELGLEPALAPIVVHPAAFGIDVSVVPLGGQQVRIEAVITPTLSVDPTVEIWQSTADPSFRLTLPYDAGRRCYARTVTLGELGGDQGDVRVQAEDLAGHSVVVSHSFQLQAVQKDEEADVCAQDNGLRLILPAGALDADATVSIHQASVGSAGQGRLMRISAAYEVALSAGQQALHVPAYLHMPYDPVLLPVDPATVRIHRWDEGQQAWIPLESRVDTELSLASTTVDHLAVFAVLGELLAETHGVFLPVLLRDAQ